jgi:hypothetical protein
VLCPNACLGLIPVVVSSKSLLTLRCGVPCDSHALFPFSVIISFMIRYARMNDLAIRVRVWVSVFVMVTVMVRVRVVVCITLRPPQRLCRSRRFQPPSRYDQEAVPCWTAFAIGHCAYATSKEIGTNPRHLYRVLYMVIKVLEYGMYR